MGKTSQLGPIMDTPESPSIPGTREHTSKRFEADLRDLRSKILEIGGIVENQVAHAIQGIYHHDKVELGSVARLEPKVAQLEQEVDAACSRLIALRQPTAIDLRMILSVLKGIVDLNRVSQKALKIARMGERLDTLHNNFLPPVDLRPMAEHTLRMLRMALDAFARLDPEQAAQVVHLDEALNDEHDGMTRKVMTFMMEDPRTISRCMDILAAAKALERIGDHAKSLAEQVIFITKGAHVQHASIAEVDGIVQPGH